MMVTPDTVGQWAEIQRSLERIRAGIERFDRLRARDESDWYWSRELTDDELEADDLWDDAQDTERFARGLGFADYDEYHAASYEAFAAWVDDQHAYERAE